MYRKTVLDNGIRVVTHEMKQRQSVAMGIWIAAGGRYEADRVKGVAHFLEHVVFKGSAKYSCAEIKEKVEGVGGSLNAFTAEEQTCYYAKIPSKHIDRTLGVLSDMVFNPLVAKKDVEKEKGVIIEEIKMYHDLPQYMVLDLLDGLQWPNHPLGKNLAGTPETVSALTAGDLREFHERHYGGCTVVFSACGDVRHHEFVRLVQAQVKKTSRGTAREFAGFSGSQRSPQTKFCRKEIEQMHLALGMPSFADEHKDKYAVALLHVILGGNMSSRLFDEVREKRGLAYSISSSVKALKDTGMFMVRAGVDNAKIIQAVDVILKELRKVRQKGVNKDELIRAKDYYHGQVLMGLEDTLDHMLWLGEAMVSRNRWRTREEVERGINAVTLRDIQRVARQILDESCYNLAVVGPLTTAQEKDLGRLVGV